MKSSSSEKVQLPGDGRWFGGPVTDSALVDSGLGAVVSIFESMATPAGDGKYELKLEHSMMVSFWNASPRTLPAVLLLTVASCNLGPSAVKPPSINASAAGSKALEMYDKNSDGKIAGPELDQAPGLKAALARIDTDGDKAITAEEIANRVGVWQQMGLGLTSFSVKVTMHGAPLAGATVTLEPEEYLGSEVKTATCTTSPIGTGGPTIAKEDRPDPTAPPGVMLGLYKVKISKVVNGKETVPPEYNQKTILGQEVALDAPELGRSFVVYEIP